MTTMRYKTGEIRHYNFTAQDKLFLDANIWLYLYGPPKPRSHWVPKQRIHSNNKRWRFQDSGNTYSHCER